jgi:hypothetical protein
MKVRSSPQLSSRSAPAVPASFRAEITLYFMNQPRPTFSSPRRPERSVGWDQETGFQIEQKTGENAPP